MLSGHVSVLAWGAECGAVLAVVWACECASDGAARMPWQPLDRLPRLILWWPC